MQQLNQQRPNRVEIVNCTVNVLEGLISARREWTNTVLELEEAECVSCCFRCSSFAVCLSLYLNDMYAVSCATLVLVG